MAYIQYTMHYRNAGRATLVIQGRVTPSPLKKESLKEMKTFFEF